MNRKKLIANVINQLLYIDNVENRIEEFLIKIVKPRIENFKKNKDMFEKFTSIYREEILGFKYIEELENKLYNGNRN